MDKLALNNEIVSMRHDIRRARVHTINKLIRTSRKLKNKHGSEEEKEKYQRKAARFMEEITIMKSLKDDEISKFALTNMKAPDDIFNDPKIPLREKTLARLSGHPNIITRVYQFRTKYPSWEDTLPKLLEQLGAKKKKKNTETKLELKTTTSLNIDNDSSKDISDLEEKQNMPSSNPEIDTTKLSKSKTVKTNKKRKELKISNSDVKNSKMKGPEKSLVEVKRFSEILKSNDDDDDRNHNEEDIAYSDSINNNKILNKVPEEKSVDPFFLCEDGETEYLTNVKKISNENGHLGEKSKKIVGQSWKRDGRSVFGQREKRHGQILEPKNFNNIKSNRHDDHRFDNKNKKSQDQKFKRADVRKEIQNEVNEPIHPSWEAKKRLQEQQYAISAFQGKKIKFED